MKNLYKTSSVIQLWESLQKSNSWRECRSDTLKGVQRCGILVDETDVVVEEFKIMRGKERERERENKVNC